MPFIPAPFCAEVQVLGTQSGQPCMYTIDANFGGEYTLADLGDLAAAVDGWWNEFMSAATGNDVTYRGIDVKGLAEEEDLEYDLSEPLPGTNSTPALPAQVAVVWTKYTGFTGRSARGRLYVWGIPQISRQDDRHFSNAYRTVYQDAADGLLAAIVGASWSPVVISRYHDGAPRVTAVSRIITSLNVRDTRYDTQRRRLGKT